MRRREFITLIGGAVTAWPRLVLAQQAGKVVPRIGVLLFGTPDTDPNFGAFRQGLRDLGYVESQNIIIEYRYASRNGCVSSRENWLRSNLM
jgi:putative tryptophan/tyrosine transport system substrate-binding protein